MIFAVDKYCLKKVFFFFKKLLFKKKYFFANPGDTLIFTFFSVLKKEGEGGSVQKELFFEKLYQVLNTSII